MNKVMLISLAILGFALSSLGDTIPVGDQLDWTHAGLYSAYPTVADTVFQINLMSGQGTNEKVLNAISGAQSYVENHPSHWAIIYFPGGVFCLSQEIVLDTTFKNIIFQGVL